MKHYIVLTRDTDIWLVGPFPDGDYAADYGATVADELWDDDPRWQTITLGDTHGLRIEPQADVMVRRGAYPRMSATKERAQQRCQCGSCDIVTHMSDCAVHNEYAARNGPCDCGAAP